MVGDIQVAAFLVPPDSSYHLCHSDGPFCEVYPLGNDKLLLNFYRVPPNVASLFLLS